MTRQSEFDKLFAGDDNDPEFLTMLKREIETPLNCRACLLPRECECPCATCEESRLSLYTELQEISEQR